MRAIFTRSDADASPAVRRAAGRERGPVGEPFVTTAPAGGGAFVQRKAACACGGGCPSCEEKERAQLQPKLQVGHAGDAAEREADAIAEQVMTMRSPRHAHGEGTKAGGGLRVSRLASAPRAGAAPPSVERILRSAGEPLDASARSFFEPRFGHNFGRVRVHSSREAAGSAHQISARAYAAGNHIVFGAGEYSPSSDAGRQLLAHELAHVIQQTGGEPGASHEGLVQRTPTIRITEAGTTGPPAADERRAAASAPISCCSHRLGTLHAMPLFNVTNGVGAMIHFIAAGTQPAAGDRCHCDDFHIIQVVRNSHPPAGRPAAGYVDNNGRDTPFYRDVFLGRRGEHAIPNRGFPDAGERVQTTESIYDQPVRGTTGRNTDISWHGEACVACVKNSAPDLILGCVNYGFTRHYNATTSSYDAVVPVGPGSSSSPSTHFTDTLRSDPSLTTPYPFERAPTGQHCAAAGGRGRGSAPSRGRH